MFCQLVAGRLGGREGAVLRGLKLDIGPVLVVHVSV